MPTLRRYLRISKYTVLETRIFLPNPQDAPWFSRVQNTAAVFAAIKHLVLPKLREARAAAAQQGKKKKVDTEVVASDGFEVGVYLTSGGQRHVVLRKERAVEMKKAGEGVKRGGWKMMAAAAGLEREREGSEEEPLFLPAPDSESDEDPFIPRDDCEEEEEEEEDKKNLHIQTQYEGFAIYDRVLCLVVTRTERGKGKPTVAAAETSTGLIEGWIQMSQAARDRDVEE